MWQYTSMDNDLSSGALMSLQDHLKAGWEPFAVSTRNILLGNDKKEVDRIHFRKEISDE